MTPLPFTVIAGFLGAGKTTLINRLLHQTTGVRLAIMVNDFGAVNVDESLIAQHDGETLSLTNGCICCSLSNGFVKAMLQLMQHTDRIDHIVVEASGVSNPQRIMDFARIDPELQPDANLVLVDAAHFHQQFKNPQLTDTIYTQVEAADLLLLTKLEEADVGISSCAALQTTLQGINHSAQILHLTEKTDVDALLGIYLHHAQAKPAKQHHAHDRSDSQHNFSTTTLTHTGDTDISKSAFLEFIKQLPDSVIRAKGIVILDATPHLWHLVGKTSRLEAHATDNTDTPQTQAVVIGTSSADLEKTTQYFHQLYR